MHDLRNDLRRGYRVMVPGGRVPVDAACVQRCLRSKSRNALAHFITSLQPAKSRDPSNRSNQLSVDPHCLVAVVPVFVTHIRLARWVRTSRAFHADDVAEDSIFPTTSTGKVIPFKLRNYPASRRNTPRCKLIIPTRLVDRRFRRKSRHFRYVHFIS